MKKKASLAFTLIELLVVISIIAILASFLIPSIYSSMLMAQMNAFAQRGQQIWQACQHDPLVPDQKWAGIGCATSTEACKNLVLNHKLNVDFSFFAAPGNPVCNGTNAANFRNEHVGWNIVADADSIQNDDTPVIFSKNLDISNIGQIVPGMSLDAVKKLIKADRKLYPFGDKGVAIVTKGGAVKVIKDLALLSSNFNLNAENAVVLQALPGGIPPPIHEEILDLQVTSITLEPPKPKAGQSFTAIITITNTYNLSVNAGTLAVWLDRSEEAPVNTEGDTNIVVGVIGGFEARPIKIEKLKAPVKQDAYTFRAFIDSKGEVREADETNNQLILKYKVE